MLRTADVSEPPPPPQTSPPSAVQDSTPATRTSASVTSTLVSPWMQKCNAFVTSPAKLNRNNSSSDVTPAASVDAPVHASRARRSHVDVIVIHVRAELHATIGAIRCARTQWRRTRRRASKFPSSIMTITTTRRPSAAWTPSCHGAVQRSSSISSSHSRRPKS